jgi:hypothetical protein
VPKKSTELEGAKAEVAGRTSYLQPNRVGKTALVSHVPADDAQSFRALLKARGTNVQEYFAQIVQNELAAAAGPEALERLVDAQFDRFRATLRPILKR